MAGSSLFGMISLILTAGACVMIFFIVLAGTKNLSPLNQVYFLWADTGSIQSAPAISEWTLWNVCSSANSNGGGNTMDCAKVHPANPLLPQRNFGTAQNIPADFLNMPKTFYYLSRFAFAFYLISLFFMIISLITGLLSLCSRLGSAISAMTASLALFCMTFTAAVMTAYVVLARKAFQHDNRRAGLGLKAMAFTWASVACLFIATALYCLGFTAARKNRNRTSTYETKERRGQRTSFRSSRSYA